MSRSHLGVRHFLAQLEADRGRRAKRQNRPEWLAGLVEEAAASFEPLTGVARVGYECLPDEGGWNVSLYLGAVEMVGGKSDGQTRCPDFSCDVKRLLEQFSRIDELEWTVRPQVAGDERVERSVITISGLIGTTSVRLAVRSAAPESIAPGLREFPDGRVESV
jgi:hypothetical protein